MRVARCGWTQRNLNFCPKGQKCKSSPVSGTIWLCSRNCVSSSGNFFASNFQDWHNGICGIQLLILIHVCIDVGCCTQGTVSQPCLLHLPINRYGDHGELVEEPAGVMLSCGIMDEEADTYAHAYVFPDNAYATLQITGVQYHIDRDLIQSKLCQTCLDSINSLWFTTQPPAEYAVISFEDKTIQPLLNAHPWFSSGNYGIDCEFKENGTVDILVHYCPNRYLPLLAWRKTQTM